MAKRKARKSVTNTCEICGETFYSAQPAKYCTHKSTCRVKHHQREKQIEKMSKALTMNMEAFAMYQGFVERFPATKEKLDKVFFAHGVDAMLLAIDIGWDVAIKLRAN